MVTGSLAVPRTTLQDTIRPKPDDRHHGSQVLYNNDHFLTTKFFLHINYFTLHSSLGEPCDFG
jgi:hypothetical protein